MADPQRLALITPRQLIVIPALRNFLKKFLMTHFTGKER